MTISSFLDAFFDVVSLVHLTVGAMADSTHEYLLKYYLMTARTHKESLEMCESFMHFI